MASNKQLFTRIPNGGFNRAAESHALGNQDFYDLLNMRPFIGALRQTDPLVGAWDWSLLTGESATSDGHYIDVVRNAAGLVRYLAINETNARYVDPANSSTQTLLPVILQTAVPNNTTINGQCLLYGFNTTDFAAAGDTIDIKIVSATQFQWRRNGGAYSASLACASEVVLGANGLKASFAITTGFTTNDIWTWTRGNTLPWDSSTGLVNFVNTNYALDNYIGGIGRTIMRVRDGFITSVGYKRVYGRYVAILENHLVVAQFAEGVYSAVTGVADGIAAATTPFRLAWSDLNNPDLFFGTDVNEADAFSVPYNTYPDNGAIGVTGLEPLRDTLVVYLPDAMYEMVYVGLPNVMQTRPKFAGIGSAFQRGLVNTKRGHYFMSRDNIYFYDGTVPVPIGEPVRAKVFGEMVNPADSYYQKLWSYYDAARQEVVWHYWVKVGSSYYQARQAVFQERYNRWFFRNMPSFSIEARGDIYASCRYFHVSGDTFWTPEARLYQGNTGPYQDIPPGVIPVPVNDAIDGGGGKSLTQPMVETNDLIYDELYFKKELDGFNIDASWSAEATMTGVALAYSFRMRVGSAVTFTTISDYWTQAIRRLGLPHTSGVVARFRMTFTGAKPYSCALFGYGDFIGKLHQQVEN